MSDLYSFDDEEYTFAPTTGTWADVRRRWIESNIVPVIEAYAAASDPVIVGAAFYVAQYWDDEAADAVHTDLVLFTEMPESLDPADMACRIGSEYDDEDEDGWSDRPLIGYRVDSYGYSTNENPYGFRPNPPAGSYVNRGRPTTWEDDSNGMNIVLWGGYAHGGSQDYDWEENYTAAWRFDVTGVQGDAGQHGRWLGRIKVTGECIGDPNRRPYIPEWWSEEAPESEYVDSFARRYF